MIAEFYKVLLTLYYISHLSCQRQLTTKWKLGFSGMLVSSLLLTFEILTLKNGISWESERFSWKSEAVFGKARLYLDIRFSWESEVVFERFILH
jgi:hypothetical protein